MLALALTVALALAAPDDPPPVAAPAEPIVAPPIRSLPEAGYAATGRWSPVHPPAAPGFSALALIGDVLLVGDVHGALWRSDDGGVAWSMVLPGVIDPEEGPGDEELLIEAEAEAETALEEAAREAEALRESATPQEGLTTDQAEAAARDRADELELSEPEAAADIDAAVAQYRNAAESTTVALWSNGTVSLAGRDDGVWRSTTGGHVWDRVSDTPGARTIAALGEVVVAGSPAGLHVSGDLGVTWFDAGDTGPVHAVGAAGGMLFAGGPGGLYTSADGLRWTRRPQLTRPVLALLPDASWATGLWIVTDRGIYRSDDGGENVYLAGTQPMSGTRGLAQIDAGHLLAFGGDGAWESLDGAVSWRPVNRGLTDPDLRALALKGPVPIVVSARGLWRLMHSGVGGIAGVRVGRFGAPPVNDVLRTSVERHGLDVDALSLARKAVLARFLPQLDVTFKWDEQLDRDNEWRDEKTIDQVAHNWSLTAGLCFGACSSVATDSGEAVVDADGVVVEGEGEVAESDALDDLGIFVLDGEILSDNQPILAAANVANRIQDYRRHLVELVTDAYSARQRLLSSRPTPDAAIAEQVDHRLKVMETEARLDLYTDGAFRRALSQNGATP